MLVDSHCHLDQIKLDVFDGSLSAALSAARSRGVCGFLCVDIDLDNFDAVKTIAEQHERVWCSVGVHPSAEAGKPFTVQDICKLAGTSDKVVAVGECGLDYYYGADTRDSQLQRFELQLQAAEQLNKPVIIHTRDAREDTLALLRKYAEQGVRGVLHCFTESIEMAQEAIDLGYYISFSGIITFRNAEALRETVRQVPINKMLVETDCPYLAPVPHRGKSNQPQWVVEVAQCVAELKGVDYEFVAQQTTDNFQELFSVSL